MCAKIDGLTLVEMLLVIGILAIIFALGLTVGVNFYSSYQLSSERNTLVSVLGLARNLALVNNNEANHGLFINADNFVVFQGTSYGSRDTSQDRTFPRAGSITISGLGEIVFAALSGQTSSTTYSVSNNQNTFFVYVNSEGRIE